MLTMLDTVSIGRPIRRGPLTVYPLYSHTPPAERYLSGPQATERGSITIEEAPEAEVPVLMAHNQGELPVLLLEGEGLLGGLQDRVLNVTVLLGTGSTRLPVTCVEAGRWRDGCQLFRAGWQVPSPIRAAMSSSVTRSMREGGMRHADQSKVWQAVDHTLSQRGSQSETAALRAAMTGPDQTGVGRLDGAVAELAALGPLPGQTGLVAAVGSRLVMAELFDRPETLRHYWSGLLAGVSLDAADGNGRSPRLDNALRFVRRLRHARHERVAGVGLGVEHRFTDRRQVGSALAWDDSLLHVATYALAA